MDAWVPKTSTWLSAMLPRPLSCQMMLTTSCPFCMPKDAVGPPAAFDPVIVVDVLARLQMPSVAGSDREHDLGCCHVGPDHITLGAVRQRHEGRAEFARIALVRPLRKDVAAGRCGREIDIVGVRPQAGPNHEIIDGTGGQDSRCPGGLLTGRCTLKCRHYLLPTNSWLTTAYTDTRYIPIASPDTQRRVSNRRLPISPVASPDTHTFGV